MANSNLTLKKSRIQLLKRRGRKVKPNLTNVAVCSGCHGCTGKTKSPIAPIANPFKLG